MKIVERGSDVQSTSEAYSMVSLRPKQFNPSSMLTLVPSDYLIDSGKSVDVGGPLGAG
jgi:hypothetical protein